MAKTRNDPQPRGHGLRVAAALEEQNAAIREIVRGVSSAATGAQGVTGNVGGLRQGADQTVRAFLTEVKAA